MYKKTLFIIFSLFASLLLIFLLGIIFLSKFGLETKQFNHLIIERVKKYNDDLDLKIEKVKIYLDFDNMTNPKIKIQINDPTLILGNNKIEINIIKTNIDIESYYRKDFSFNNISIITKDNKINDLISIVANNGRPQLIFLNSFLKEGVFSLSTKINFDKNGNIKDDYSISGNIKKGKVEFSSKNVFENINFKFKKKKDYNLKNANFSYKNIKLSSDLITVKQIENLLKFEGDLKSEIVTINSNILTSLFQEELNFIEDQQITIGTKNKFNFSIKKNKLDDLKISSKINLKNININFKSKLIKNYFSNYKNSIVLKNNLINIDYDKEKINIEGKSNYSLDILDDEIIYNVIKKNNSYEFQTSVNLKNNPLAIKFLSYNKGDKKKANIQFAGKYYNNQKLHLEKIFYKENNNNLNIKNLNLSKDFKINYVDKVDLNITNKNDIKNKITIDRVNKKYKINGKIFDTGYLIDELLKSQKKGSFFDYFNNFNSEISVDIDKSYIDNISFFENLTGKIKFKNNQISSLDIAASIENKKFSYIVKKNNNNEKITSVFLDYPEPLVKKYKFIKGFKEGSLDYSSVSRNNISKSQLKIYNFKLRKMPVLTKILTLASLQGIADILTGEGIRFDEFDMKFSNKKNVMSIDEIYAIGPAISIMMSGYIEIDKLVSLRGTLVPATTINKTIASIPILGDILIGKKTGEGVFGVSFKIKGPPKKLKTTVNPIKTLTPRFITRTLEKIKKGN